MRQIVNWLVWIVGRHLVGHEGGDGATHLMVLGPSARGPQQDEQEPDRDRRHHYYNHHLQH